MNVNYGFTMVDVMTNHFRRTFHEVDIERLRDFQDLTLMWIDLVNERLETEDLTNAARGILAEDLRLFGLISWEIGTILTAEFYAASSL